MIDARRPESTDQLRKFAPDGLDGALALAGGDELEQCLDFMRPKGRVVHPNGIEPVPKERRTFRVRAFDAIASPREFDKLNRHLGNGRIRVPIAAIYPLGKAAQAHRRLDREHPLGRMVLQVHARPPHPDEIATAGPCERIGEDCWTNSQRALSVVFLKDAQRAVA